METAAAGHNPDVLGESKSASFDDLYNQHVDFVWRSVRGLGVAERYAADATQDVFIVAHRQLAKFEGRSSLRGWLFGITRRVARDYRRRNRRKDQLEELPLDLPDGQRSPHQAAVEEQAFRKLLGFIEALDLEKREAFVMADLEQLTVPEISEVLGVNANTIYSRLRAARQEVEAAIARSRLREDLEQS